jgi:hypothetical protein
MYPKEGEGANLKRSTTMKGAETSHGDTIVVSWAKLLAIVEANER